MYLHSVKTFLFPSIYIWLIIICCSWWVHWQLFVPSIARMQQLFLQRLVLLRKCLKQLLRPSDSALVWALRRLTDCTRFCISYSLENQPWKASCCPRPSIETLKRHHCPLDGVHNKTEQLCSLLIVVDVRDCCIYVLNKGEPIMHLMGPRRETEVQ